MASIEQYLSPMDMESQEHLNVELLKSLVVSGDRNKKNLNLSERPPANYIDLMNWVVDNFAVELPNGSSIEKFVQNRIIIDGPFVQFCRESDVKIECLYKDAIISWKTENNFEKFFVQGVFKITKGSLSFIHAALFHKGNQNEDEVSFFIIVNHNNYDKYIKLRNSFDDWVQKRDRSNLHVRVMGGDDIPYTKELTWEDLYLPKDLKKDIIESVDGFLTSEDFYKKHNLPWKRGMLLYGAPGNGKSTIIKILMSVYDFKPITVVPEASADSVREAFSYAQEASPALLYFEDLGDLLDKHLDLSTFLNLMDGVVTNNGLFVVATTNEVEKLKDSISDRPSRFDRKFEIPLPTQELAYIYLKRWFGKLIPANKCKALAKFAAQKEFSYDYLKEFYISAMFEALANKRQSPNEQDMKVALDKIVKDKNISKGGRIKTEKYFS